MYNNSSLKILGKTNEDLKENNFLKVFPEWDKIFENFTKSKRIIENFQIELIINNNSRNLNLRIIKEVKENEISGSIGYVLPTLDSLEDHLGLAVQLGELITNRDLHCLAIQNPNPDSHETEFARILMQSTRVRLFRTEFISAEKSYLIFFKPPTYRCKLFARS